MKAIYKYVMNKDGTVKMPKGWRIVSVKAQGTQIVVYALVPVVGDEPIETVQFRVIGTGWNLETGLSDEPEPPMEQYKFLSTCMLSNGMVFHVFLHAGDVVMFS